MNRFDIMYVWSLHITGSLFDRVGSVTEEAVLCFRVGGWWPVITGVL